MPDNNVLSLTTLASKRQEMINRGGVNWLIDLFINELPNYINELQQAITAGDGEALYLAAHKFRGSSSNLGAIGMIALCKQLEALGRAGDIEQATLVMENDMDREIKRLTEALKEEKKRESMGNG